MYKKDQEIRALRLESLLLGATLLPCKVADDSGSIEVRLRRQAKQEGPSISVIHEMISSDSQTMLPAFQSCASLSSEPQSISEREKGVVRRNHWPKLGRVSPDPAFVLGRGSCLCPSSSWSWLDRTSIGRLRHAWPVPCSPVCRVAPALFALSRSVLFVSSLCLGWVLSPAGLCSPRPRVSRSPAPCAHESHELRRRPSTPS